MRSYYINLLSSEERELLSKKVNLDEIADYDLLLVSEEEEESE